MKHLESDHNAQTELIDDALSRDVCWYDFGAPHGSKAAKRRPAVVVQSDACNACRPNTTLVVRVMSGLAAVLGADW
jgi:mRNA-degrading endonuclease toxin of MazEF toxin-antitoxin module